MDTKPVTEVFPLDEGNESITQRRGWIKINITGPLAKACPVDGRFPSTSCQAMIGVIPTGRAPNSVFQLCLAPRNHSGL
jgi:hypothetical protein